MLPRGRDRIDDRPRRTAAGDRRRDGARTAPSLFDEAAAGREKVLGRLACVTGRVCPMPRHPSRSSHRDARLRLRQIQRGPVTTRQDHPGPVPLAFWARRSFTRVGTSLVVLAASGTPGFPKRMPFDHKAGSWSSRLCRACRIVAPHVDNQGVRDSGVPARRARQQHDLTLLADCV